jgi:hypothetical protein
MPRRKSELATIVRRHGACLVGQEDDVAPPGDSRRHAERCSSAASMFGLALSPGLGHKILVTTASFRELGSLVRELVDGG